MGITRKGRKSSPFERHFDSCVLHLARECLKALGSPVSRRVSDLIDTNSLLLISELEITARDYADSSSFRDDLLAVSLLSKFPFDTGVDRRAVALEKFCESERRCRETNHRLLEGYVHTLKSHYTPESIMFMAREKIARLLGPFSWDLAEPRFAFGPGATYRHRAVHGDRYYKFRDKPDVTRECAILAYTAIRRIPSWYSHLAVREGWSPDTLQAQPLDTQLSVLLDIVPGNRVTTVAKNAKTDRTIAIEPTMNGFIQHGIGSLIRSRLRRACIDLNDQTPNQIGAKLASLGWNLSTLDLKSASDTVSLGVVQELLPPDWMEAIMLCRSPVGTLPDGTSITYQKVSSMGNGFTFELESLIFWAICSSVTTLYGSSLRHCFVYGDDIIVPADVAHTVVWMLEFAGFEVNPSKSHLHGVYHESCGKHYFHGDDVTPLYIREDIRTFDRVIWFANQVRRWSRLSYGLDSRMYSVYSAAVSILPRLLQKPTIPDGLGDGALFGDFDEVCPHKCPRGHGGWLAVHWSNCIKTRDADDVPYLLRQLSRGPERTPWQRDKQVILGGGIPLPGSLWRKLQSPVLQWQSYGPWL